MIIESISSKEYFDIVSKLDYIPVYSDIEAINIYSNKEFIKVSKNGNVIAVMLVPIDNNGVRREYRYFPYINPILLEKVNNVSKKNILKLIFNYLFKKYDYTFIPLHPSFKLISSIQSEGGLVEMRHTHITNTKLTLDNVSSKLRNHIRSAEKNVQVLIDSDYSHFGFADAIKGSSEEILKRSELTKKLIDNGKGIVIKAIVDNEVKAGVICVYDKEWSYLLHSYQDKSIRGVIPLLILKANEYLFDRVGIKYFDFEGSVIDEIDDFFSSFNVDIINYPYVIEANTQDKLYNLINRSMNIEGRIKYYENK